MYPRNVVCFKYIIVNILHKGDNKDNNPNVILRNTIIIIIIIIAVVLVKPLVYEWMFFK